MNDIDQLNDDLRSIRVEETRLRPLGLDRMFDRATEWKKSAPSAPGRAPSPPRMSTVYPLPLLYDGPVSPLGKLFGYPEMVPHVLKWFARPGELATLATVSWGFKEIVQRKLYGHIWIRPCERTIAVCEGVADAVGEAHCDEKLLLLFRTLQTSEELCKLIRHLGEQRIPLSPKHG